MNNLQWQQEHREQLLQALRPLQSQADGVIFEDAQGKHCIQIHKQQSQLLFYFVDVDTGVLEGPMSRIDVDMPLNLLSEYTQAAMLSLLWQDDPQRVCVLGLAGGRISLVLYHYFPQVLIDNVDVDPASAEVASGFFGLTFDDRQRLFLSDARAFLEQLDAEVQYDILVMDAFSDADDNLDHLATRQFYQLVLDHLSPGGIFSVNLLKSDPRFFAKVKTFLACFKSHMVIELKHSLVLFGTQQRGKVRLRDLQNQAASLQQHFEFEFPFEEHAANLRPYRDTAVSQVQSLASVDELEDGSAE